MSDLDTFQPIDRLRLPTRVRNVLVRAGVTTPERLAELDAEDLLALRGFGETSLAQVRERLAAWKRERRAAEAQQAPVAETARTCEPIHLLPGRRVLHAHWMPYPQHRLFIWGEGPMRAPSTGDGAGHPFQVPPETLRAVVPGGEGSGVGVASLRLRLPTAGHTPLSSPQLVRDIPSEEPAELRLAPWAVVGLVLSPLVALRALNDLPPMEELAPQFALGTDLFLWSQAAKLALELLARQQFVPTVERADGRCRAVWAPSLDQPDDLRRVERLAEALPDAGRALGARPARAKPGGEEARWPTARALLKDFLAAVVNAAVRAWSPPLLHVVTRRDDPTVQAWLTALFREAHGDIVGVSTPEAEAFEGQVSEWVHGLLSGAEEAFRICFRLEAPAQAEEAAGTFAWAPPEGWVLRFFLQARDDPSLLVPARRVWQERDSTLRYLDRRFDNPQERLLIALEHAARLFEPLERSLHDAHPEALRLSTQEAYRFLREAALLLEESGFGVLVPQWWRRRPAQLGARAIVSAPEGAGTLNLDTLTHFRWQLAVGQEGLTPEEFEQLVALKLPLVRVRGEWVELRPEQVEAAIRFWEQRAAGEERPLRHALRMGLAEETHAGELPVVDVRAEGQVGDLLERLRSPASFERLPTPEGFVGRLRPYQVRGFSWLTFLHRWGLGACLADDMGLGKTIQAIALVLHDVERARSEGSVLVICPTSVVGNWAHEIERFAPQLRILVHHGGDRASGEQFVAQARDAHIVISTYTLARLDVETLGAIHWAGIILDEAQNIKNPAAQQTRAIRRFEASYRVALTGTPIENRLTELWSIMEFLNPGYLGSKQAFLKHFARPIERYRDPGAAQRLRQLVRPFVLRRVKTDPAIIRDLPEKLENKVYCTLTPEQATLYEAVVQEAMGDVDHAEGIQRRGLVLSMLLRLKQICNHPAQFLGDGSTLPERSGKLERLREMLEEVLAVDERALVFTQFSAMGALLQRYLRRYLGAEVLFLHGGTPMQRRSRMVERFQQAQRGPSVFVLSLKAGGLGLNLTRANHVFHYDRWWNPAVENQATDRVFRIGQKRDVWVHKFVCVGTLEERIDALIESKQALAESVIGTGEAWLTELTTEQLHELVALHQGAVGA